MNAWMIGWGYSWHVIMYSWLRGYLQLWSIESWQIEWPINGQIYSGFLWPTKGQMNRWTDEQMNRWTDEQIRLQRCEDASKKSNEKSSLIDFKTPYSWHSCPHGLFLLAAGLQSCVSVLLSVCIDPSVGLGSGLWVISRLRSPLPCAHRS